MRYLLAVIAVLVFMEEARGQLGFCQGNSGDPIFTETFGTGTTNGPALPAGTTTYNFTTVTPFDGSYTISSRTNFFDWHDTTDRTPGDTDGKSLIVNADFTPGEFFRRTVNGLCENTSYEFSSWLLNLLPSTTACPNGGLPINVTFQIWDVTDTQLLASGSTGEIRGTPTPRWEQHALTFTSVPGQTAVILKMINNGEGGCGNDLAIDDIVFRTCGDFVSLTDIAGETFMASCEDQGPVSTTLTANPDFSIFNSHAYQWQVSLDGTIWNDIPGETTNTYTTPLLNTSTFYRVKVAEDPINISNSLCNIVSEVFDITIVPIPAPPTSNGDLALCSNALQAISVSAPAALRINWYDAPVGGNLIQEDSPSLLTAVPGTYYAEANSRLTDCSSPSRTAVTLTVFDIPVVTDEEGLICEGGTTDLFAGALGSYLWSTGETTASISVDAPGTYQVTVTNTNGCAAVKTIVLEQIDRPIISEILSDDFTISISTENEGDFEFALDDGPFQDRPVFELVEGGLYLVRARAKTNCPDVSQEFLHFVIPKFFSPNGDTINDTFTINGLEFFSRAEVSIFDRYGRLLVHSTNGSLSWDGTFNNRRLPESDYWYRIRVDDQEFRGHFTLKR
ncbi:T9SS type B sorting domain-containing protein [Spongiimicrobium salis]|uniref:T9SS type B sorting domain-containing protein n=1 Tax=Spongiimicrobium salis TaxID=1667022 RepID=UPI00374D86F9